MYKKNWHIDEADVCRIWLIASGTNANIQPILNNRARVSVRQICQIFLLNVHSFSFGCTISILWNRDRCFGRHFSRIDGGIWFYRWCSRYLFLLLPLFPDHFFCILLTIPFIGMRLLIFHKHWNCVLSAPLRHTMLETSIYDVNGTKSKSKMNSVRRWSSGVNKYFSIYWKRSSSPTCVCVCTVRGIFVNDVIEFWANVCWRVLAAFRIFFLLRATYYMSPVHISHLVVYSVFDII